MKILVELEFNENDLEWQNLKDNIGDYFYD